MDKIGRPIAFSMLGNFCFLLTFLFIGPVPFLPLAASKGLIQGMMAVAGVAYASLVVSSFSRAQKRVLEMGFSDDIHTYVMISGQGTKGSSKYELLFCKGTSALPFLASATLSFATFACNSQIFVPNRRHASLSPSKLQSRRTNY